MYSHIFSNYQCHKNKKQFLLYQVVSFWNQRGLNSGSDSWAVLRAQTPSTKQQTHSYEERADRKLPPETIFGNSFLLNRHNTEVTHCCGSFTMTATAVRRGKESEADIFPFDTQECQTFLSHQNLSVTFFGVAFPWRAQRQERQWRDSSRLFTAASRSAISPFFSISSPNFISTLPHPPASPWLPDKVSNTWAATRYLPCVLAWWRCSLSCGFPASSTVKSIPTTWRIES